MRASIDRRPDKGESLAVRFVPRDQRAKLQPAISEAEFSGKSNSLLHLRESGVLLVGLGERAAINVRTFRNAAGAAAMFARKGGRRRLTLELEVWPQFVGPAIEGVVRADYRFEQFKQTRSVGLDSVRVAVLPEDESLAKKALQRALTIAEGVRICREIGNQPGNLLYPEILAKKARELALAHGLKATVLDEKQLRAQKFGGILAVGAGSIRPPRLIVLEHRKGPKTQAPLVLVGKAVTFDSGGISLKQAAGMEHLIYDKCGGVAVLGAMVAIAKLGLKQNVVGIIPSAENLPSASSYRPGDIVTAYDGTHIEIINTDAEGRIILADAIAFARRKLRPAAIIDAATLTGACGVALGEHAAGLWSNDEALLQNLQTASDRAGERLWPMPSFTEYDDQIRSDVAQLKNTGGRLGGACTGAAFLKAFAGEVPWAHLDIASVAHREKDQVFISRGATGFGVKTLVELAESWGARPRRS